MEQFYPKLTAAVRRSRFLRLWTMRIYRMAPWFFVFSYLVTFLVLLASWNLKWIFFLIVPAVVFIAVSIMRALINYPRPFQKYHFDPILPHKKGQSFPSRHTASAVVIAMACLYVSIPYGIIMLILSTLVAVTRVMVGIHYIRDILAAAVIAVGLGLLGFFIFSPLFGL